MMVCKRFAPVASMASSGPADDAFDLFRVKFGEADDGVQAERHHTGKGTDANGDDEHDRHDQRFHGAQAIEEGAGDVVDHHADRQCGSLGLVKAASSKSQQRRRSSMGPHRVYSGLPI